MRVTEPLYCAEDLPVRYMDYKPTRSPARMIATMRRNAATYVQALACTNPPLPNVKFARSCWADSEGISVPIPSAVKTSVTFLRTRRARSASLSLQDTELHPFGELERRMDVVGHDDSIND